ncbi:MAG: hypothetical protein RLZ80_144, partial [Actinomycetota bacterium]
VDLHQVQSLRDPTQLHPPFEALLQFLLLRPVRRHS